MTLSAAIAGASGYAGGEVIRFLCAHPQITPATFTAHSNAGELLGTVQPHLRSLSNEVFVDTTPENLAGHDVVFLALPHGKSGALAAELAAISPETLIVDCGADHRLHDEGAWDDFYGGPFNQPWTYGVPELLVGGEKQRVALAGTKRIAAPGCNASTVALALAPAVARDLVDPTGIVASLAVGPSGAGKALRTNLLAAEILGSASPYAVGGTHRHIPEIEQALTESNPSLNEPVRVSLTPALVPMARGILAMCSAPLRDGVTEEELRAAYEEAYSDERFVEVLPRGQQPSTGATVGANTVLMSVQVDERARRAIIVAAVDNLAKGTAGAAIQSANIALGLPEDSGLTVNGVAP